MSDITEELPDGDTTAATPPPGSSGGPPDDTPVAPIDPQGYSEGPGEVGAVPAQSDADLEDAAFKEIFRRNAAWVQAELQHMATGADEDTRAELNP
jgi:hypothetical protein